MRPLSSKTGTTHASFRRRRKSACLRAPDEPSAQPRAHLARDELRGWHPPAPARASVQNREVAPEQEEDPPPRPDADTASPPRNFALGVAERVSAAMAGVPAYARRLRAIEDLQAKLARRLHEVAHEISDGASHEASDVASQAARLFLAELARLNDLIDRHNRYYPIERNLPSDPRTGAMLDRGRPWQPLGPVTLESLRARQR
jgi:hypothetical protein